MTLKILQSPKIGRIVHENTFLIISFWSEVYQIFIDPAVSNYVSPLTKNFYIGFCMNLFLLPFLLIYTHVSFDSHPANMLMLLQFYLQRSSTMFLQLCSVWDTFPYTSLPLTFMEVGIFSWKMILFPALATSTLLLRFYLFFHLPHLLLLLLPLLPTSSCASFLVLLFILDLRIFFC